MLRALWLMPAWLLATSSLAGDLTYRLGHSRDSNGAVSVSIECSSAPTLPATLVMPRTYPGGYAQLPYDEFVTEVTAVDVDGVALEVVKVPEAPRWRIGAKPGDARRHLARLQYRVDLSRMEEALHDAVSSSRARDAYVGILGYSVFAYVEGLEDVPIHLEVRADANWPLLLTLDPKLPLLPARQDAKADDFYALADSQILMGPALQVVRLDGRIPLVLAMYAEGPVDADLEAHLAREALDHVQQYFGDAPISHYTVQLELLEPKAGHAYGFSQEHIDSGSFSLAASAAIDKQSSGQDLRRTLFNYAHHMAHSWIPKRAYGPGYRPFTWEMTPVMDTVWFNEGFGRYAAIAAVAAELPDGEQFRAGQLERLRSILAEAPPFIRRMPLSVLSREASFLYSADFRTGMNTFARGALMAAEMDEKIAHDSGGKRSLRDALRALLVWSEAHHTAFDPDELPQRFRAATGVDVREIFERWQRPLP
jgi:predicted metalloprotease with PDZ domain